MKFRHIRRVLTGLLIFTTSCSLVSCSFSQQGTSDNNSDSINILTIATADSGGTMFPVGRAIAHTLETDHLKFNLSASTGSSMNVKSLLAGEVDLALVSGDTALAARESGTAGAKDLYAIAAVFFSQSNWLAPVETEAVYVHDLIGKRLGVGPENSTTELAAEAAIQAIGLDQKDTALLNCGLGMGTELVINGDLDAIHGFSGPPIGALGHLAESRPCRVLLYTPEELEAILHDSSLYLPAVLPAGTYSGQLEPVDTFGIKCLLCVNGSMEEELAYSLTKSLWEGRDVFSQAHPSLRDNMDSDFLFENLPIPLHPGSQRFYQEICSK